MGSSPATSLVTLLLAGQPHIAPSLAAEKMLRDYLFSAHTAWLLHREVAPLATTDQGHELTIYSVQFQVCYIPT
jgi:hypothetical protein